MSAMASTISEKEPSASPEGMKFDWAGCLSDLREQYTSVELQHQINLWREEMALGHLQQDDEAETGFKKMR